MTFPELLLPLVTRSKKKNSPPPLLCFGPTVFRRSAARSAFPLSSRPRTTTTLAGACHWSFVIGHALSRPELGPGASTDPIRCAPVPVVCGRGESGRKEKHLGARFNRSGKCEGERRMKRCARFDEFFSSSSCSLASARTAAAAAG